MLPPEQHKMAIESFVGSHSHLGTTLRPVEVADAEFILSLRGDPRLNRHISFTPPSLDDQRRWIGSYLGRYRAGQEAYFIVLHDNRPRGTIRLYGYDQDENSFVSGSWLIQPGSPNCCAFSATILDYDLGFGPLGFSKVLFDVRKDNKTVWKFHESIGARLLREDKFNRHYEVTACTYSSTRAKLDRFAHQLYERPVS